VVLHEHPEWQKPLFEELARRKVAFEILDLKNACFSDHDQPRGRLYFNQASPSAYVRGNVRAVPLALALIEDLEAHGARVLNGSKAFRLELSKLAQVALMRRLGIHYPRTWAFNDPKALLERLEELVFPALLKPNQGGSGARMFRIESVDELSGLLDANPDLWFPDNLLLIQELVPHDDHTHGSVRIEFLGGEFLYALRVVSHGNFNLCPSDFCNPLATDSDGTACATSPEEKPPPEFFAFPEVPDQAVATGRMLFQEAGLDVGAVEYLEANDGRRVFYDINANSNLRRSIGQEFGFDPFERVVDYLEAELRKTALF
jgi:glutathione synthase/RimK-type ligase-like ATP-grasp enzyme